MQINVKMIDEMIEQYNEKIDSLTLTLNRQKIEFTNLEIEKKKLQLELEDEDRILKYQNQSGMSDSHAAFTPYAGENKTEPSETKKKEIEMLHVQYELVCLKLEKKQAECDHTITLINDLVDHLTYMEGFKKSIKQQVDTYNNEYFVKELKEIVQKKRLIQLEKTKYSSFISKLEKQNVLPTDAVLKKLQLALSFVQTDPVRAKQELEIILKQVQEIQNKTNKLIHTYRFIESNQPLCDLLNNYIGSLTQIYPDIKFHITVSNLEQINQVNSDLNRCLLDLFKGLLNSFILKCSPMMVYLRFAYDDGYLIITGKVIGEYINFYNEMRNNPSSIVGNLYERVFLLNGDLQFKNNKDGTFNVKVRIPIKNYLS